MPCRAASSSSHAAIPCSESRCTNGSPSRARNGTADNSAKWCPEAATTTNSSVPKTSTCASVRIGRGPKTTSVRPDSRSSIMTSTLLNSDNSRCTSGCRDRQWRSTGSNSHPVIVSPHAMRINPAPARATRWPICTACSAARSATRASSAATLPATVTRTPRHKRSATGVPSSFSREAIWCESAGCDICNAAAAALTEPWSTKATKHSNVRKVVIRRIYRGSRGPNLLRYATSTLFLPGGALVVTGFSSPVR